MDTPDVNAATLLQRKKKPVKIGKNEIILILRSYVAHPTKWGDILENIRQNIDQLPPDARRLYQNGSLKQLRDRMSGKLGKLLADQNIEDTEIRAAVHEVKDLETRLVKRPNAEVELPASQDIRDNIADQLSDTSDTQIETDSVTVALTPDLPIQNPGTSGVANTIAGPRDDGQVRRPKKRPLADLIRENQQRYNRFIRKKIPKLMRQLGVSSDSSDSN